MSEKTVLHIEDDPAWTAVVARAIKVRCDLHYLGSWPTARAALTSAERARPAVVLASARACPDAGFAALAEWHSCRPPVPVALLTDREDDVALFHARQAWIAGMMWKREFTPQEFDRLLDRVSAGQKYLSPAVAAAAAKLGASPTAFFKILSDAELRLLPRFAGGASDDEIAAALGASRLTIKCHRNRIMAKLDVHRTEKLMRWCIEKGFAG
jgi:DNA-binding NarL/FixJ family response regulator